MSVKSEAGTIVSVTSKGQATIPKEIRDRLGIDAPGRVRFRETEHGVVVEPVEQPGTFRGFARSDTDESARDLLDSAREADRERERTLLDHTDEEA